MKNAPLKDRSARSNERHKLEDVPTFSVNALLTTMIVTTEDTVAEINGAGPMEPCQFATTLAKAPLPAEMATNSNKSQKVQRPDVIFECINGSSTCCDNNVTEGH